MKKTIASLVFAAVIPVCTANAAEWSKIRIGVEGAYPPFSEIGADGKIKGFDIDIANALCAEMKAQCELVQQEFDGMIPGLLAKKIDAVVASMSITDERKKSVDFTDKYYQTPARMVARQSAALDVSPAGMKGKKIGVQRTTVHDRFATATFTGAQIVRYTKQDDVFLDLVAGRVDAGLVDMFVAQTGFLTSAVSKGFGFVGPIYSDQKYFGDGQGIAVRKSDADLREKINAAIKAIRANGTYKKIQAKYFNFDVYGDAPPAAAQAAKK